MIPTIHRIGSHLTTNLVNRTAFGILLGHQLAEAIIATFHLAQLMIWDGMAEFLVHVFDVVKIVHIVHEPAHLLWDFALSVADEGDDLRSLLTDRRKLARDALEEDVGRVPKFCVFVHFFFFLKMPVFASALLNSLPTAWGTPT